MPTLYDQKYFFNLIKGNLVNWFGSNTPVLDSILQGIAETDTFIHALKDFSKLQTRIQTATGFYLDYISKDFFGNKLPRHPGELDDQFRTRIFAYLIQERCTRLAFFVSIYFLTGQFPVLFEPWNPFDCGGYNVPQATGYDIAGRYGSASYPYQGFVDVYVSDSIGMSNYSGYDITYGGYSTYGGLSYLYYGGDSLLRKNVTDMDIYNLINAIKVYGTLIWVRIHRSGSPRPIPEMITDLGNNIITDIGDQPILGG